MLTELLAARPGCAPGRWTPCPPAAQRAAWDALPASDRWIAAGNEAARSGRHVPPLPLSLWLEFSHTGNRSHFEQAYFTRRRTLCRLVMAECCAWTGDFLPLIADYVWAICEESAWQLPPHNSYVRDAPQLPLPDARRPVVDLFAAETAALLAMVHYLLGRELEQYAPGIRARIRREVEARTLRPWRTKHFWWMGNGDEPMCNWTPWCTQNLLIAAALLGPAARLPDAVRQAAYSLDCFLNGYGEDGCCNEGAQYYSHAGLCLFNALDLLCALAPGVFEDAWRQPKLKNMAEYIAHMHVDGPWYFNFADCSAKPGRRGVREYLFGRRVGSEALAAFAALDYAAAPDPEGLDAPDMSDGINLFYHVQRAFAEAEVRAFARSLRGAAPAPGDIWYPSVGVLTCRRGPYALGAKAGGNDDSHNHNDTGSVTLYKDGRPLLIDVGVGSYTRKTFSPRRYEIWTMQSSWHNLPEFDPEGARIQQLPGPDHRAAAVQVAPALDGIAMDLAPAYPPVPGLGYYRRTVRLTANGLALTDETDCPAPAALTLMSVEKPAVERDTRVALGGLGRVVLEAPARIETEAVPVTDPRLRIAWPDTLYRTRIYFTGRLALRVE